MTQLPNNITQLQIKKAIKKIDLEGIPNGATSSIYDLLYQGNLYPPKLVLSWANIYVNGKELNRTTFKGGENTAAFRLLRKEGFSIWKKTIINNVIESLKEFKVQQQEYFQAIDFYLPRYAFYKTFFSKEHLKKLEWKDIQLLADNLHAFQSFPLAGKKALGEPNHAIEHYKKVFYYLRYGEDSIDVKIDNLKTKDGEYHLINFGKSSISELVGYAFPEDYIFYNKRDISAVELLKIPIDYTRGSSFGEKYLCFNKELQPLYGLYTKYVGLHTETSIPLEVDQFLSWVFQNKEHYTTPPLSIVEENQNNTYSNQPNYWLYAPGHQASKWDEFYEKGIMGLGWDDIGNLSQYETKEAIKEALKAHPDSKTSEKNSGLANYDFKNTIKKGDIIVAKKGRSMFLGYGIVSSDYFFDETLESYQSCRRVNWIKKGEWKTRDNRIVLKTLTNITKYPDYIIEVQNLLGIEAQSYHDEDFKEEKDKVNPTYSIDDALKDLFVSKTDFEEICESLEYKKNIILQGPPGVGKTFIAKRIAKTVMGFDNENQIEMIQFHQSYSYEDFIQGIRPNKEGKLKLQQGIFVQLCERARLNETQKYFLIIDEINRGNLSKIFGELMLLIEHDKRGQSITLTYGDQGEKFSIPANIYLIGTMNTADRSLAMVDYALRRRFSFISLKPSFGTKFKSYLQQCNIDNDIIDEIVRRINSLNETIKSDFNLGKGFMIGHSYFCNTKGVNNPKKWYNSIVKNEIIPMLHEYWFDDNEKVLKLAQKLYVR